MCTQEVPVADFVVPLQGGCFCGEVSFTLSAPPLLSAYCHCTICQCLTSCPFVHTMHFDASAFTIQTTSRLDSFSNPVKPHKNRWRCKNCGTSVSSYNSRTNQWSVWGCTLERDDNGQLKNWDIIKPTAHIFYGTRVLDVGDNLSKWEGYENRSVKLS